MSDEFIIEEKLKGEYKVNDRLMRKTAIVLVICIIAIANVAVADTQEKARSVYNSLNQLVSVCTKGINDIYGAWYFGALKAEDYSNDDAVFLFLSRETSFDRDELKVAAKKLGLLASTLEYDWQSCVKVVIAALHIRGDITVVKENMEQIKNDMKLLYGTNDYELLKKYYISVNAYADFFLNPTGNLHQYAENYNKYKEELRNHRVELDLWYGE